jgi:hypothetical protein
MGDWIPFVFLGGMLLGLGAIVAAILLYVSRISE